jgi:uncharacterized membrane protein
MKKRAKGLLKFLATTAIGGVIFLLPLIVIGALLGQVAQIVWSVYGVLGEFIPVKTPQGITLLVGLAIAIVVLACFFAGLAARRSLAKRFSQTIEKNLLMIFPRYAIFKYQMEGSIGGQQVEPRLKPVLVTFHDASRIAFEVERNDDQLVTIYLPGSPDPWSGSVIYLKPEQVEPLEIEYSDAITTFEQLGRHSDIALAGRQPKATGDPGNGEPKTLDSLQDGRPVSDVSDPS